MLYVICGMRLEVKVQDKSTSIPATLYGNDVKMVLTCSAQ